MNELNQGLLRFMLNTIHLHKNPKITYEQLKTMTVNQYSAVSTEVFQRHYDYLKDDDYIEVHQKSNEEYIDELNLTFYGKITLKKLKEVMQFDA